MSDTILKVDNLKISFRTMNGNVQAVRNVSFDLEKGKTLAIVGESGSGKSVTSRAILGILANNAIVESGEIIYDGKDLLKIDEEHFHAIRGDKIAMIFQDPMSSLNPIMRIGKQLTEAMLLKNKASREQNRKAFNTTLAKALEAMNSSIDGIDDSKKEENKVKCENFDKFEYKHLELEGAYNNAMENLNDSISLIDDFLFKFEKNAIRYAKRNLENIVEYTKATVNHFVIPEESVFTEDLNAIEGLTKEQYKTNDFSSIIENLKHIKSILEPKVNQVAPNFFSLGYYLTFESDTIPQESVEDMNKNLHRILDEHFMLDFIQRLEGALKYTNHKSIENTKVALKELEEIKKYIEEHSAVELTKADIMPKMKSLITSVKATNDELDIYIKSPAYTFDTSCMNELEKIWQGTLRNKKEQKRFDKQNASYQKKVDSGKTPDWKIVPLNLWDLETIKLELLHIINNMSAYFENEMKNNSNVDFSKRAVDIIDFLKDKASNVVTIVNNRIAKKRAIKLLEEVGITEPEKRYRQYPFEFSGGMRQRIVIAIALAANPEILICDEPTTALDVTIQSQILELINKLKVERNLSIIFITHDLGVVANMADNIAVMYAGKIVEYGTVNDIFYRPAHPYTWALLSSMPDLDTNEKLEAIPGTPPNMIFPPVGDAFAARNKYALKVDFEKQPPMFKISDTHCAATWLLHPNAPKVNPPKIVTDRIERMHGKKVDVDAK